MKLKNCSVFLGESFERFNKVKELLETNNIDYKHKIHSHNEAVIELGRGVGRSVFGETAGMQKHNKIYELLVAKVDLEKAQYLIRRMPQ